MRCMLSSDLQLQAPYFPAYVRPFDSPGIPGGDSVLSKICLFSSSDFTVSIVFVHRSTNTFLQSLARHRQLAYVQTLLGVENWKTFVANPVGHTHIQVKMIPIQRTSIFQKASILEGIEPPRQGKTALLQYRYMFIHKRSSYKISEPSESNLSSLLPSPLPKISHR